MTKEQEILVTDHLHIAKSKAGKWARQQNVLSYDEVLSTAYMALVKAAQAFDATRGCHFMGFVSICIDNAIRNEMKVPIPIKKCRSSVLLDLVADETAAFDIEDILSLRQTVEKLTDGDRKILVGYLQQGSQRGLAMESGMPQARISRRLKEIFEFIHFQMMAK